VFARLRARAQNAAPGGAPPRGDTAMRYAKRTQVSIARSRAEIENIVERYGADQFGSAFDQAGHRAMIQFRISSWLVRFVLPLPNESEQDQRQRWRALALVIKAKLEAVESQITTIEEEFLAHVVTPSGETFGQWAVPQLREARARGELPGNIMGALEDKRGRGGE
jgi:hypothetical protein